MSNIIIHDSKIYDADEYKPSDFQGFVLYVSYDIINETETHESHGLHTISTNTIQVNDSYLAYDTGKSVVYSYFKDDNVVIEIIKQFYDY